MSKSILIKDKDALSSNQLQKKLENLFVEKLSKDEFLLNFDQKNIWLFFEDIKENIYNIEFSKNFQKKDIIEFIEILRSKLSYKLLDIYIW